MIDMHTHLDLYPNALDILDKVNTANKFTLAVTTSPRAWIASKKIFSGYNNIKISLGLHPEVAIEKENEIELLLDSISQVNFVGEIGIDGSKRHLKSQSLQESIFKKALMKCQDAGGRIISIHSRDAVPIVLSGLHSFPDCGKPILHWFTGSPTELKSAIDVKCYFSVNPLMAKSKKGKEILSIIPKDLILPESDGPFAKQNGRPIMPWEAISISQQLSEIWKVPVKEAKAQMSENLMKLLSLKC